VRRATGPPMASADGGRRSFVCRCGLGMGALALDEWRFLGPLFAYDFFARSVQVIEGTAARVLPPEMSQKNQTAWLLAGRGGVVPVPIPLSRLRKLLTSGA